MQLTKNSNRIFFIAVEDNAGDRRLLVEALKDLGIHTEAVFLHSDEVSRFCAVSQVSPYFILIGYRPHLDPEALIQSFKSNPHLCERPIILLIEGNMWETAPRLSDDSFIALTKPVTFEAWIETVRRICHFSQK